MIAQQRHLSLSILTLALLLANPMGASQERTLAGSDSPARIRALQQEKAVLEIELRLVRTDPEACYLVIDLSAGEICLKLGARLLSTCSVRGYRAAQESRIPLLFRMVTRIDPFTPEPANRGLRLRGRRQPLDFIGRLIEGPGERSRLYFSPRLVIQPVGLPAPPGIDCLELEGGDIKSLGSALQPGNGAILIPPLDTQPDGEVSR